MKKPVLISILLAFSLTAYNQIIKGTIFDRETKKPVTYATVYFNGTSVAAFTNDKGFFRLDIKKNTSMPLTVSALGYYSETISDFSPGKDIQVYLLPKIFEVDEVNIKARGNPRIRRQNLEIFRREFLGRTENTKECEIVNEDDIRFITSPDNDTLRAFSLKPINVVNTGLGYKITYYLNKFEYIKSAFFHNLVGDFLFTEDTVSILDRQNFKSRRLSTYYGSKMHFLRSLYRNDLKQEGYSVINEGKPLSYYEMVRYKLSSDPAQTKRYIHYSGAIPDTLIINWLPGKAESGMELFRDYIYFDEKGYFKGPGIIWHGEMAKQGIADLLPYEYQPPETINAFLFADSEIVDTLSVRQTEDQAAVSMEKVYLHTDRDFYNTGDDIWLMSYVVDGLSHKLSDSSGNLHVELISPDSKIIESRIIRLDNGLGNGDFILADTLKSGEYRVRAYTNYMRNFGDQSFFNKYITVVNSSDTTVIIADNIQYSDGNIDISFFPEGGSMVDNVLTIVAFKAVSAGGKGSNVSGEVYSTPGNLITSFRSSHLGMGTFSLKPVPGLSYYAIVRDSAGEVIKRDIPRSFPEGIVVNAAVDQKNNHIITIKTNPETLQKIRSRNLLLTISAHNKILKTHTIKIDSLFSSFILPTVQLPDGIVMLTLYDPDNIPLCERLIYIQNNADILISLETDKTVYKQRDSVSVRLSLTQNTGITQYAFLSLSVTDNIYTDKTSQFPTTISSWFLLESDVKGPVEDPSYYFDTVNPNRFKDLDLLLLTQGWRDFEWKYTGRKYLHESGFTISGLLKRSITDAPLIDYAVTVGIFKDERNIITTVSTDSAGRFHLDLENLTGNARLVVSATDKKGNFQGRISLDSLSYSPSQVMERDRKKILQVKESRTEAENFNVMKETDIVKKSIRKKYTLSDTILIDEVQIIGKKQETPQEFHVNQARMVYGKPDDEVIITPQLESSRSIRDALIGKVAGITFVNPKTAGGNPSGIIFRGAGASLQSTESGPLFLLDGLVVSYSQIESLPFNWIDRIDVIMSERAAAYGVRGANGVISVITKTYKDLPYQPVSYSVNAGISGYNAPRIFYSPTHSLTQTEEYKPDLRSTLYWFPDMKVITNMDYILKYFNADISSTYRIIVEGITSGGIPVSGRVEYEVK